MSDKRLRLYVFDGHEVDEGRLLPGSRVVAKSSAVMTVALVEHESFDNLNGGEVVPVQLVDFLCASFGPGEAVLSKEEG